MKKIITFALLAVLTISFASCGKQQTVKQESQEEPPQQDIECDLLHCDVDETVAHQARQFVSERGDYSCDLLYDKIDTKAVFPQKYFDTNPKDYLEPLCAHNERQYLIYKGTNKIARNFADYYNTIIMYHNLLSDDETACRFGEDDNAVYRKIANAILKLTVSVINNDTLRQYVKQARDNMAEYVRNAQQKGSDDLIEAFEQMFGFILGDVNPVIENTNDAYQAYMKRSGYFKNFDAIKAKRGVSDKTYQQQLLNKMYLAKTPDKRHVYAIEFAHSDSTHAHFLVGAAVLNREFVNGQYSPYLSEMWHTWRASVSTLIGASSWSYIPNLMYNQKRAQVAEIIIKYIEKNPTDILAQGLLIDLAGCDNISRHGSIMGNAAMIEQMYMFPEWEAK